MAFVFPSRTSGQNEKSKLLMKHREHEQCFGYFVNVQKLWSTREGYCHSGFLATLFAYFLHPGFYGKCDICLTLYFEQTFCEQKSLAQEFEGVTCKSSKKHYSTRKH